MNNPLLTEAIGVYFLDMDTAVEEEVHPNEDGSFSHFHKCQDQPGQADDCLSACTGAHYAG